MSKTSHTIFIFFMTFIVILVTVALIYIGNSYYNTSLEERFYHIDHKLLKPSGIFGHGLGIVGSLLILIGVSIYMLRKRVKAFSRFGLLKHWLEFHIFLCTLGTLLVIFHTAFKFGGLVSISFWSMIIVFTSGVIGRFIYIQIPRTIEGRELSLGEVRALKNDVAGDIKNNYGLNNESYEVIVKSMNKSENTRQKRNFISQYFYDRNSLQSIRGILKINQLSKVERKEVLRLVKNEISLNSKISRLLTMQKLFGYWHVAHLPFAIIMLIIMIIHVIVTLTLGYRWIF